MMVPDNSAGHPRKVRRHDIRELVALVEQQGRLVSMEVECEDFMGVVIPLPGHVIPLGWRRRTIVRKVYLE